MQYLTWPSEKIAVISFIVIKYGLFRWIHFIMFLTSAANVKSDEYFDNVYNYYYCALFSPLSNVFPRIIYAYVVFIILYIIYFKDMYISKYVQVRLYFPRLDQYRRKTQYTNIREKSFFNVKISIICGRHFCCTRYYRRGMKSIFLILRYSQYFILYHRLNLI